MSELKKTTDGCLLHWLFIALVGAVAGCGTAAGCGCSSSSTSGGQSDTKGLVWRCSQAPVLSLTDAWCSCTGYSPGQEQDPLGGEVSVCDAKLPCCFVGAAPANKDGSVIGKKECRCVHDASCSAEMAKRQGVTQVSMCPPEDG